MIVCASNGKNLELGTKISDFLKERKFSVELIDLTEMDLPLYSNVSAKKGVPESVKQMVANLKSTSTVFFLAPEYNGGIPPVLTNFIAWASASSKDWRESFNSKTAVIGTHSGSGGLHALMSLRVQLAYIGMNVLGRQLHTHYKKDLNLEALESIAESIS